MSLCFIFKSSDKSICIVYCQVTTDNDCHIITAKNYRTNGNIIFLCKLACNCIKSYICSFFSSSIQLLRKSPEYSLLFSNDLNNFSQSISISMDNGYPVILIRNVRDML